MRVRVRVTPTPTPSYPYPCPYPYPNLAKVDAQLGQPALQLGHRQTLQLRLGESAMNTRPAAPAAVNTRGPRRRHRRR